MKVIVNGKSIELAGEISISEFLHSKGLAEVLVAVEHNLNWTSREQWPEIVLKDGDRLEVVRIMAGG